MKPLVLLVLLTSMLFSYQKQIVLGCFLQEKYAKNELKILQNHLQEDKDLKKVTKVNALRARLVMSEGYHVLVLSWFDDKNQLFLTYHLLKRYYDDAYALEHGKKRVKPAVKHETIIKNEEPFAEEKGDVLFAEVESEAEDESEATQEIIELKENPEAKRENNDTLALVTKEEVTKMDTTDALAMQKTKVVPKKVVPKKVESTKVEPPKVTPVAVVKTEEVEEEDYFIEYILAFAGLLVLIGMGFFIKREIKI